MDLILSAPFWVKALIVLAIMVLFGLGASVRVERADDGDGEDPDDEGAGAIARSEAVRAHVERHIGPVQEEVFSQIVPGAVHAAINFVPPSADRPYWYAFTTGMSERPMPGRKREYAELAIALPPDWVLPGAATTGLAAPSTNPGGEGAELERNWWPLRWLMKLADLPHELNRPVGPGVSVPNGDPAEPFAENTSFDCMLLWKPALGGPGFDRLRLPDGATLHMLALIPLYPSEVAAKLRLGPQGFIPKLEAARVTELLDPRRPPFA